MPTFCWHIYSTPAYDFGWNLLRTVNEARSYITNHPEFDQYHDINDLNTKDIDAFMNAWFSACAAARYAGWDGDFRIEPRVFALPGHCNSLDAAFVIKQNDNGTTFFISPHSIDNVFGSERIEFFPPKIVRTSNIFRYRGETSVAVYNDAQGEFQGNTIGGVSDGDLMFAGKTEREAFISFMTNADEFFSTLERDLDFSLDELEAKQSK
ncbi:TPA: hypothetical protein ACLG1D_001094 [Pseudomonas aeruginosa]